MAVRAAAIVLLTFISLAAAQGAAAQTAAKPLTEDALKEMLVWNSPWEGRSMSPPSPYSYRHVFRQRRDTVVAEIVSLSTNQRSDSVVTIRDGALSWRDSSGAEVTVAPAASGELVGTAKSSEATLQIVLRPRP